MLIQKPCYGGFKGPPCEFPTFTSLYIVALHCQIALRTLTQVMLFIISSANTSLFSHWGSSDRAMVRVLASHQCGWLLFFLWFLWFSSLHKNQHLQIVMDQVKGPAWKPAKADVSFSLNIGFERFLSLVGSLSWQGLCSGTFSFEDICDLLSILNNNPHKTLFIFLLEK